jgi:hypothetical protein
MINKTMNKKERGINNNINSKQEAVNSNKKRIRKDKDEKNRNKIPKV